MTLVSDNIRYLRKLNGLTQEQFSRKINIKRSLLGAYEEGRANPNQQNIQAIARAFNTTVELLTRQDLRKLRETPNLSIPLGQSPKAVDLPVRSSAIRSDGKLDSDEDDPFQHPDFPDIFAHPAPKTPEPQPLTAVLSKFYKQDESGPAREPRPVPAPPVITSPVRPTADRIPVGVPSFQTVSASSPVDRLFGQQPDTRPAERLATSVQEEPPVRRSPDPQSVNGGYDNGHRPALSTTAIPVVMQGQFTEYSQRYQQGEYVNRLPAMHLPTLPDGHYRAFEAGDDFTFPGALLVGQLIRNWFDIADGKMYVLLVQGTGICCRRVFNQVKVKGTLLLTADRADIANREVPLKDVLEVWDVRAFVSQQLPPSAPSTDRLRQLVDELRFEVERL